MASGAAVEAGKAYVLVQLRDGLSPGFSALKNRLQSFSREVDAYGQSIGRVAAVATSAFAAAIGSLVLPVKLAAGIESLRAEFTTLTGSIQVANRTLESLRKFANVTPFGTEGLARATALLLNFGIPAKQAVQDIRALGEISGGSQEKLNLLALAFAQVGAKGRLMGQEALQLTEQGFNPLQEISRMTGQSMLELSDAMSKGSISFDQVRAAVVNATSVGGRFNGMLDRMSKTVSGQWASLREELSDVARSIGEQLLPTVREWISYARDVIKRIGDWVRDNKALASGIAALATGLGVFTVAMWGVRAALGAVSTFMLIIAGGLGVIGKLFGSTSKKMNQTARETKEAATGVTSSIVAMSTTSDPLLIATKKLVADLALSFRRVGTVAKASMAKVQTSVDAAAKSVTVQVAEMIAAIESLNVALATLPGASMPDVGDDKKKKERKPKTTPEVGGIGGRAQFFAAAAAGAGAEKALADNLAKTSSTVQVANRELAAGLAGRAALIERHTATIAKSTQVAGLQGRAAMVGAATASTGVFARMIGVLGSGLATVGGLLTGTTALFVALGAAATAAIAYVLNRIGYMETIFIRLKNTIAGVSGAISTALGGVGRAIAAGQWVLAFQIAWQGMKLAALKALEGLIGSSGNLLQQFGNFIVDFGVGIGQSIVDLFIGIGRLAIKAFWAAMTGLGDAKQFAADIGNLIADTVAGSGSTVVRGYADEAEKELNRLLDHLPAKKSKEKQPEDSKANEQKQVDKIQSQTDSLLENLARGVDVQAARLPKASIDDANKSAAERLQSLKDEITELKLGKSAFDQHKLALSGVTAENRKSIAALEAQKVAIEATNSAKDKIKAIQDEIAGIKFGTEKVERYRLAQEGADKATLARLATLQQEKLFLETSQGIQNQINESVHGAEAANLLRLAQAGLNREQVAAISSMQELAKKLADTRSYADQLNEKFKNPLQTFEETTARIRDAQLRGLISQEVAAKALTEAVSELQAKKIDEQQQERAPLTTISTPEKLSAWMENLRAMANQNRAGMRGQKMADDNAKQMLRMKVGNQTQTPLEQKQLESMQRQEDYLRNISLNANKPKVVVSIR